MNWAVAVGVLIASLSLALGASNAVFGAEPPQHLGTFGPDGTETSDFENVGPIAADEGTGAVYVGDPAKQVLYKFDEDGTPLDYGGSAGYLSGNEITGLEFPSANVKGQAAVDQGTHVVYVTSGNAIRAFDENGEPHEFAAGPGAGTNEIPGAEELVGIAVDPNGTIYASDFSEGPNFAGKVRIYARSGELITSVNIPLDPTRLAVGPNGDLYVETFLGPVEKFVPSAYPVTSGTTYTQQGPLDAQNSFSVAVDPTTEFVYIGEASPQEGDHYRVAVYDEEGSFVGSIEEVGEEGERPQGIAVNGSGHKTYVAIRNEGGTDTAQVEIFGTFQIPVERPTITGTLVTDLTSTSATLRAKINPNTLATTYRFEYGTGNCATEPGVCKLAAPEGNLAAGHNPVPVSVEINGLAPGTKYYYRVVAENSEGITEGPVRTFTTQGSAFGFGLVDQRAWEQVSPINKFGGVITNGALAQAAADGSGIAFMSRGSIVREPEGNRALEPSAVLARRDEEGWHVNDLVPPHTESTGAGFGPEYKLFSSDLERAVFEPRDATPLSPESSERTPYLRVNTTPPVFRPLVTSKEGFANVPPGTVFGGEVNGDRSPVSFSGADENLTHLVISSAAPLVAGAPNRAIYMWVDGKLKPVSELPAGEGGGMVLAKLGSGLISIRHAVSADGSRVFWSPGEPQGGTLEDPALYLRDTVAEESVRLDVVQPGATGSGAPSPVYMGASADGRFVFFTDGQQLTEGASPTGRDLYRCEIGSIGESLGCTEIINISAPLASSGESAEAQELALGMSDDGTRLYFVAKAVLDTRTNQVGESAVPGSPNLYVWHEGDGVRFIAPLSTRDAADWGRPRPGAGLVAHGSQQAATSSRSGQYLTFMSERNLTGGESNDPENGEPTEQAFLYNAVANRLVCVSCNPTGATDAAHLVAAGQSEGGGVFPDLQGLWAGRWVSATLPEGTEGEPTRGYAFYHPRAVLDNGRVYFNSVAPLVPTDSNGTWDVYQYEPFDVGSCTTSSGDASSSVTEDGCIGLISSGADEEPSVFLDAGESGDDVFFLTYARLSPLDSDNIVDVYDARVNGVSAVAEQPQECSGEGCRPATSSPSEPPPGSAVFNGSGNLKTNPGKHCRRGQRKVRRKGKVRCVKHHKRGHHHRHSKHGRAGR